METEGKSKKGRNQKASIQHAWQMLIVVFRKRLLFTAWIKYLLAFVFTIIVIGVLILLMGASPFQAFITLIKGSLFGSYNVGQTLTFASLIALTGLAAAIPFTARLFNIGAEGQMYVGAIIAAGLGVILPASWPSWLMLIVIITSSCIGGAIWGFFPGIIKARFNASEVVTTLMLNFVAILLADYAISTLWPQGFGPQTKSISENAILPIIWPGTQVNFGIFLTLAALVIGWLLISRTSFGFSLRSFGANPYAARLAGIRTERLIWVCFSFAGAFAGLTGAIAVLGINHALISGFSADFGFLGLAVALVAGLKPIWIAPSALFFAILRVGGNSLKAGAGISPSVGDVLVATFVLMLIAFEVIKFRYSSGVSSV